jgi:hypothetical protein
MHDGSKQHHQRLAEAHEGPANVVKHHGNCSHALREI